MESLYLAVPDTHYIVGDEGHSHILGSVSTSRSHPGITIELRRLITNHETPKKRLSFRRSPQPGSVSKETVVRYTMNHSPDNVDYSDGTRISTFNFALPIPSDLPISADTILGSISYVITATISGAVQHSPISIRRLTLPHSLSYARRYPDRVTTDLSINRDSPHDRSKKATYQLNWLARSTVQQVSLGIKYIVAKQLQWRVDETTTYTSPEHCQYRTHTLCRGRRTGRWVASRDAINIPFAIHLPALTVNDIRSSYGSDPRPAITVEHTLHLEVIAGEDTFDAQTGTLIDRRVRDKTYRGVYVLPVDEVADGAWLDQVHAVGAPPVYQALDPLLPAYSDW